MDEEQRVRRAEGMGEGQAEASAVVHAVCSAAATPLEFQRQADSAETAVGWAEREQDIGYAAAVGTGVEVSGCGTADTAAVGMIEAVGTAMKRDGAFAVSERSSWAVKGLFGEEARVEG